MSREPCVTATIWVVTRVSDVSALKDPKSLTSLGFRYTQVTDVSVLKDIQGWRLSSSAHPPA